jgi:acyl-coenzyme A thioesterase PaaI-like protein
MATAAAAPTSSAPVTGAGVSARIRSLWARLSGLPGGKLLFSKLLGYMAPYTGSITPRVVELRQGYARVEMRDRRGVRNHLKSIHAIALANIAEAASGLAMIYGLPDDYRGILTAFSIEYVKKARGPLVAECDIGSLQLAAERREYEIEVIVRDRSGEVVARARPRWLIGPAKK